VAGINAILAATKISFASGSADISGDSLATLDEIATVLKGCTEVKMEIGAHSDSQGREEMNLNLSQARADSVLNGLLARRVLTSNLTAVGYGETRPIADNETEEGREANRRIEFTLVLPEEEQPENAEAADGTEAVEQTTEETAPEDAESAAPTVTPRPRDASETEDTGSGDAGSGDGEPGDTETGDTETGEEGSGD
jgi:OOP family OmpA-OmpF porin